MEWIKRNKGFVAFGVASLVLLGVATWFLFAQMGNNDTADQTLNDLLEKRSQLWSAKVHPVGKGEVKNIDLVRKDRERLGKFLAEIKAVIPALPPRVDLDDQGLKNLLEKALFQMGRSVTNAGIALPDGYAFSFAPLRTLFRFNSNSINPLVLQLGDVQALTGILVAAHVNAITGVRRSAMTPEDQAANGGADFLGLSSKTNEFTVSFTYELSFQAFSHEIAEIVNRMMQSSERCIVVKDIDVGPAGGAGGFVGGGIDNPYGGMMRPGDPRAGMGRNPYERYQQVQQQPVLAPAQPVVVLDSQPLRITLLVDVVRLVGSNTR